MLNINPKSWLLALLIIMSVAKVMGNVPVRYDLHPMGSLNRIEVELFKGDFFGKGVVRGVFKNIQGNLNFSIEQPQFTSGNIFLNAQSLHFGYHKVDGDSKNSTWLDIGKYPEIVFELKKLKNPRWSNNTINATASGMLSLKSKKILINFPVKIKYGRSLRKEFDGKQGDLLLVKGEFKLSRSELGINPGKMLNIIADEINIKISLAGSSLKSRPLLPSKLFF
jgi:polyisoprenoid-binding protein YceI